MLTKAAKDGLVGAEVCEISYLLSNLAHIRSVYFQFIHICCFFVVLKKCVPIVLCTSFRCTFYIFLVQKWKIQKFLKFLVSLLKSGAHPEGGFSLHLNRADTERFLHQTKQLKCQSNILIGRKTQADTNWPKLHNTHNMEKPSCAHF